MIASAPAVGHACVMRAWVALAVTCAAGCGSASTTPAATTNAALSLPIAKLASAGIQISAPTSRPLVSRQQAIKLAGGSAIDVALEHVTARRQNPPIDADGWVVSLDPRQNHDAAGPPGSSPAPASFWVVVIDSKTGAVVEDVSGA